MCIFTWLCLCILNNLLTFITFTDNLDNDLCALEIKKKLTYKVRDIENDKRTCLKNHTFVLNLCFRRHLKSALIIQWFVKIFQYIDLARWSHNLCNRLFLFQMVDAQDLFVKEMWWFGGACKLRRRVLLFIFNVNYFLTFLNTTLPL